MSLARQEDSVEEARSLSRVLAHQYSQIQHKSQIRQSMGSPVALKIGKRAGRDSCEHNNRSFLASNTLTKSVGVPKTSTSPK